MANYIYYNANPHGERTEDCVTRSISLASGRDYYDIQNKLYHIAELLECEKLCVCCYKHLIEDVFKYKRVDCDDMTVEEFADNYPHGVYLVRMNGHISTVIEGAIIDIWDCRDQVVTDAWQTE